VHALALHVGFGTPRAARHARARRRAEAALDSTCAAREELQVAAWLAAARAAASGGAHGRAATLFRNVLGWRPSHAEATTGLATAERAELLQRSDSLTARREHWGAAAVLERAHALFPADSLVTARLRSTQAALGNADRTRNDAAQRFTTGVEAYAAQDFAAATRAFEAVLDLDPAHALAGEFLQRARAARQSQRAAAVAEARSLFDRREFDAAAAALDRVTTPGDPEVARLRAGIERERDAASRKRVESERLAAARREDRSPAPPSIAPRDLATRYERGMQLYRSGDLVGALGDWEVVARHDTAYGDVGQYLLRVYRVCGLERYTEGQLQQAIALWDKALQLEPQNAQLRRYRAQAEAKLRRAQPSGGRP
jgi:tetratricopeptide (TPR) repeat protein